MPSAPGLTARERVLTALAHEQGDRIPIQDEIWTATLDRWRLQGLPEHPSPDEYFGFEFRKFGLGADLSPQYPVRVLERSDEYIVETTAWGGIRKNHLDRSTTPEIIDYRIRTRDDWEDVKKRLVPSYTRVDWLTLKRDYERARERNLFVPYFAPSGYDNCQLYIRSDELLPLLLTDPDWIREMAETQADLVIEMAKILMNEGYEFDGAFLANDMGYRNGPFFSPRTYRQVFWPADRRMFDFFHDHDMPALLHCCGDVRLLIPDLIDAGLDCLQPLEVKAGMDLVELKREYGRDLTLMGGIDVRAMADPDPAAIEEEIRTKIPVAKVGGGYIYHSDHSIPYSISFDRYRHILELVREYGQY